MSSSDLWVDTQTLALLAAHFYDDELARTDGRAVAYDAAIKQAIELLNASQNYLLTHHPIKTVVQAKEVLS